MSNSLKHRGPDDEGFALIDKNNNTYFFRGNDTVEKCNQLPHISSCDKNKMIIGFAHRRLSIIDLSSSGHQPMSRLSGSFVIVHNGEIYNYKEIKKELLSLGYQFRSKTDTEVILNAYIEWGEECVQKFIGMWAFGIWDKKRNTVFLSRDRFGIKPLYYEAQKRFFVFASEIKALMELENASNTLNYISALQYLSFGSQSDPNQTLFEGVREVPPGTNLIYDCNTFTYKEVRYYDLNGEVEKRQKAETSFSFQEYRQRFTDSIDIHLRADVPIGSCLSGGLDSSAIVSHAARRITNGTFSTFTAAYKEKDIDESEYAKLVSSSNPHIESFFTYPSSSVFWNDLDRFIRYQDLPVNSTSMFAQWEVMKLASEKKMKVLLDGQGADETLGGYENFAGLYLIGLIKRGNLLSFMRNFHLLNKNRGINSFRELGRTVYYILPESLKIKVRERGRIGISSISPDFRIGLVKEKTPDEYRVSKNSSFTQSCILAIEYGLRSLLRYEDRNSMAFSIESRVPFLDHRLVEYTLSLPIEFKFNGGWSKYVLRKAIEGDLPESVVWRRDKKGFITPQKVWKHELNDAINRYFKEYDFPDFLDKNFLIKVISGSKNNSSHLSEFWRVFSFLKWLEVFKVKI